MLRRSVLGNAYARGCQWQDEQTTHHEKPSQNALPKHIGRGICAASALVMSVINMRMWNGESVLRLAQAPRAALGDDSFDN